MHFQKVRLKQRINFSCIIVIRRTILVLPKKLSDKKKFTFLGLHFRRVVSRSIYFEIYIKYNIEPQFSRLPHSENLHFTVET